MEDKRKHLEFIQGVINRLAGNSFLIKGWCVTLVSALFALSGKDSDSRFIILAYFPVIMFWILDAYFLWQERLFRGLYNHVSALKNNDLIDYSMKISSDPMGWANAFFSVTLLVFYGTIIVSILLVMNFV